MEHTNAVPSEKTNPENVYWAFTQLLDVTKFFRNYCYQSVTDLGFSMGEIDVLVALGQNPSCNTVKAISETVHLSKGMISQAVESLRQKQFLTVGTDEHDRRQVLISLTGMAQPILERLREAYTAFVERIVSGISPEQLKECLGIVTQVYTNKQKMKAPVSHKTGSY